MRMQAVLTYLLVVVSQVLLVITNGASPWIAPLQTEVSEWSSVLLEWLVAVEVSRGGWWW